MLGYGEANYGRKKCPQCIHGKKKKKKSLFDSARK